MHHNAPQKSRLIVVPRLFVLQNYLWVFGFCIIEYLHSILSLEQYYALKNEREVLQWMLKPLVAEFGRREKQKV